MQSMAIRLGIVGAIVLGGILLRPFLPGAAGALDLGDCFDLPSAEREVVEDVQYHPCTDAHDAEVIFVGNYEPADAGYPTEEAFRAYEDRRCIDAFQSYTGLDYYDDESHDFGSFHPTLEGWQDGDHVVICYIARVDGQQLTQSVKKQ